MGYYIGEDNKLRYHDYGDSRYRGDCVDMVMQLYGLNMQEALEKIAGDFGLLHSNTQYKKIVADYSKPVLDRRRSAFIQMLVKQYSKEEILWWEQYGISLQQLKDDNVYSVKQVYLNRKLYPIQGMTFGYWYPEGVKIYMPQREKEQKWISSITTSKVENIENLKDQQKVLIVKSKKDRLCLTNILPQHIAIIGVQNESISAFSDSLIEKLTGREVWLSYDNDPPGKKASLRINQQYQWMKHINVPDIWYEQKGYKDWSDMVAGGYKEEVIKHMTIKKLI